jgi:hypothetical protein
VPVRPSHDLEHRDEARQLAFEPEPAVRDFEMAVDEPARSQQPKEGSLTGGAEHPAKRSGKARQYGHQTARGSAETARQAHNEDLSTSVAQCLPIMYGVLDIMLCVQLIPCRSG